VSFQIEFYVKKKENDMKKKLVLFCSIVGFVFLSFASVMPYDVDFKKVWNGRMIFDGEMPFPEGVSFLPLAHYSADVKTLPASICIVDKKGEKLMSFPAPENFTPPYTMHIGLAGKSKAAVFVTKDGKTSVTRIDKIPTGFDPRKKEYVRELEVRLFSGNSSVPVRATISAGIGQADVRFITRGRSTKPYMKDGRMYFTFSIRYYGSGCGIGSLDPRNPEKGVKFEGTILFDCDDGLYRNDLAPHIYYDDEAGEWRGWVCNFSTGADDGISKRAPGGVNATWAKDLSLKGLCIMKAKPLGLEGMNEDPCCIWDESAGKWRLFLSKFTPKIRAQMLESDRWDGGFKAITSTVPEDSTGTTIVTCDGKLYCLSGSVDRNYYVYSYPDLKKLGALKMSPTPWGDNKGWPHGRGWPAFVELPDSYPHKYLMLTMDRINFPGMPKPNWTYGELLLYVGGEMGDE
jgi:hypothetical protein